MDMTPVDKLFRDAGVRITTRRRRFIEAYFGDSFFNAVESARTAGYGSPEWKATALKRELAAVIAAKEIEIAQQAKMSAQEVQERLASVARDPSHKDHVRALELLAKIHGLMSEKINVNLDRKALMGELDGLIERLGASGRPS